MSEFVIQARQLKKTYWKGDEEIRAVDSMSIEVVRGDSVALTGPSGSGKSTLMHVLGCLDAADEGEYLLDGQLVSGLRSTELSRVRNAKLGFIFQSYFLLPHLTALENTAMPLLLRGAVRSVREEAASAMLSRVGLLDRRNHLPHELSGGQRQRVAIARALVTNPIIVLADEPTGNLDGESARSVLSLFDEINAGGTTVVVVTHSDDVAQRCQTRYRVQTGQLSREA